jgi:hypothetical protein
MSGQRRAEIGSSIFWSIFGGICLGLGILWLIYAERVLSVFSFLEPLLLVAGLLLPLLPPELQAEVLATQELVPPPYGNELTIITGIFLLVLGTQMVARTPGTRIVAAYAHAVLGTFLAILLYLLLMNDIPWPSNAVRYLILGGLGLFLLVQVVLAWQLFQPAVENNAYNWQPFPQCRRCGRRLNEQQQCPVHDVAHKVLRLIHDDTNRPYAIPFHPEREVSIGKAGDEDVFLDPDENPAYAHISRGHVHIRYNHQEDKFYVIDQDSTNGTKVAEQQVNAFEETLLPSGATLKLAEVPFTFEVQETSQDVLDGYVETKQ